MTALIQVEELRKWFPARDRDARPVQAVNDVSFEVRKGEVLGLVGESGSGKSTIGQMIMGLHRPDAGRVVVNGQDPAAQRGARARANRRAVQMVFQDPSSCLNPRMRIGEAISEPLRIHRLARNRREITDRVAELLTLIGLDASFADRFPHQLSGGQRQRVGIARALSVEPQALIADEAVSALDVSVQAQILQLLGDLRKRLDLTMLFISHDMSVVEYISDRVAVLYFGRLVELAPAAELFVAPRHPYTQALLSAIPRHRRSDRHKRILLSGDLPDPTNPPGGCVFSSRCPVAQPECRVTAPRMRQVAPDHAAACLFAEPAKNGI